MRDRNAKWGERTVREAVSLSAIDALNLEIIDYLAADIPDLLKQMNGRHVTIQSQDLILNTASTTVQVVEPDWRTQLLGIAFRTAEAFLPSFGALGIGGIIAFVVGPLMLIDTGMPGYGIF